MSARVIHKFNLAHGMTLSMPADASVLSVVEQAGHVMLWAALDPDAPKVDRSFRIVGTGYPWPAHIDAAGFIGTIQARSGLVIHVFEVTK